MATEGGRDPQPGTEPEGGKRKADPNPARDPTPTCADGARSMMELL